MKLLTGGLVAVAIASMTPGAVAASAPADKPLGSLETVATFTGPMPTGVAVSKAGRVFVNFPRWGDKVPATVAEVVKGKAVAYPPGLAQITPDNAPGKGLVSVQSVVVDPADQLWILDTGSPMFKPTKPGGPKLVGVDLKTNKVVKTITFPSTVALPTTYLNDVRFDLRRGTGGLAYITDSSGQGPNGLIVVDLATGKSWRRLNDHASTRAVPAFLPFVEGRPVMQRKPGQPAKHLGLGSDGIAISADGETLYYCPLAGRRLFSVSVDALSDPKGTDDAVAKTVKDLGEKGASDGLETDSKNRVYLTEYETNAVARRWPDGHIETVVHDPRLLWPDTLSVANGWVYVTANQLHRQKDYNNGKDLRQKPYSLFRFKIDAGPVALKK